MVRKPFSDQLREAVEQSGKSRYLISLQTGILQSTLSRFVHGECGLGLGAIDRLCDCIGAELKPNKTRSKGK
jgi:hypothetical protein